MINQIKHALSNLRDMKPLVLCITNYVTMDFMANSLLALGAAPLMSESLQELEELVTISQAIYINIGTLNDAFMERALSAAAIASTLQKPVILDPVGAGASVLRTTAARQLLNDATVIRGNASEIIALSGAALQTKGVETVHSVHAATKHACQLAQSLNKVMVISGPTDFITNGKQQETLPFGSTIMPLITGMGCTMTAVLSAFVASNPSTFDAAIHATAYFGLCGQLTHEHTKTPGTFRQKFIDNLYQPNWDYLETQLEALYAL
jgi:hydroxyethylthiazole kinase